MGRKKRGTAYRPIKHYTNQKSQKMKQIWAEKRSSTGISNDTRNEPDVLTVALVNNKNCQVNIDEKSGTSGLKSSINIITDESSSWGTDAEYQSIVNHKLEIEREPITTGSVLPGNYIVQLQYVLEQTIHLQYNHSLHCTFGKLEILGEHSDGLGLVHKIDMKCIMCNKHFVIKTEDPQNVNSLINTGFVWGTLSSGSTFTQTKELLQHLDIKPLNFRMFSSIEQKLQYQWKDGLWSSIEKAGKEEYEIAKEKGSIDKDGMACITVYVDGGWSKRSYGHNYNAASGTAVVIGKETGKLLFIGVRNKYCSICARAANQQKQVGPHLCWKNWSSSSSAMEADILVEGFNKSIEMHNLKYTTFVGDGDSNVYSKLKERVSYGLEIEKIECTNHVLKNFGKTLFKLKKDTSISSCARSLLTNDKIKKLQQSVLICINNAGGDVEIMKQNVANVPYHVFDDHDKCNGSYCNVVGNISYSKKGKLLETGLIYYLNGALENVMRKAYRLMQNETNNRAETFMSILSKFNCGKRLNLTQRGSFQMRAYLSGLRYNEGVQWEEISWKNYTNIEVGHNMREFIRAFNLTKLRTKKTKLKKPSYQKKSNLNTEYGPNAEDCPLTGEEFESEVFRILNSLQITNEQQLQLASATIGQFNNSLYRQERKKRLTASNFGEVIKRRNTTLCTNLIKKILYNADIKSASIKFGIEREKVAIAKFTSEYDISVSPAGFFVDVENGYMGASPDGLIGKDGLIEVKCSYKLNRSGVSFLEAAVTDQSFCLHINANGQLQLKRNHNYYYQVQGQLNISKRKFCYFIIYINDEVPLYVERIEKDEKLWYTNMVPKILQFYKNCVLSEIINKNLACGRHCPHHHTK